MVGIKKVTKKDSPLADKRTSKTVKRELPKVVQLMQRHTEDTKGTLRFAGVNSEGVVLKAADCDITQLYVQRHSKAMKVDPRYLRVTIEVLDKLPED
jgi:hypothetical protein